MVPLFVRISWIHYTPQRYIQWNPDNSGTERRHSSNLIFFMLNGSVLSLTIVLLFHNVMGPIVDILNTSQRYDCHKQENSEIWKRFFSNTLKCIWCCYKSNSFTRHLLHHKSSEMGLFLLNNLCFPCSADYLLNLSLKVVILFQSFLVITVEIT